MDSRTAEWFVDPERPNSVNVAEDGTAVENDSSGVYADIPADEAAAVLRELNEKPWRKAIGDLYESRNNWLFRIVTDPSRAMPIEIMSLKPGQACLDVGSGWGQLSVPMVQGGCRVVALDLTLERLRILRAIARQEGVNLFYAKGNILTFPFRAGIFDRVIFSGSLEWTGTGRVLGRTIRDCQVHALQAAAKAAKSGGLIYIGIENAAGLKYLMGARDDHTRLVHFSFRAESESDAMLQAAGGDRASAKTWGLNQLRRLAADAGLEVRSVFGCFPDYKLPRHLVPLEEVNSFVIKSGVDWEEHHGDNGEVMADQDAIRSAYRALAENGIAQWFCPSYALILVKP